MKTFAKRFDELVGTATEGIYKVGAGDVKYLASETLGEIIEKLLILHVRIWNLEDAAGEAEQAGDVEQFMELHKKLEICDKVVRPRLMEALGLMLEKVLIEEKPELVRQESLKRYGGYE